MADETTLAAAPTPEAPAEPSVTPVDSTQDINETPEAEDAGSPEPATPAAVATPKTPAPVAAAPATPAPVATAFDFTQHTKAGRQRYQALEQYWQRFTSEKETAKTTDLQALVDYEKTLNARGDLPEEAIKELVGQKKELQAQAQKNIQDRWNSFFQQENAALTLHAKQLFAQQFAQSHGAPVADLLQMDTPREMALSAKGYAQAQKIATLEKENAKLKKALVPAGQRLATTGAGHEAPGLSDKSYKELLQSGKTLPDAADIDRLTAKYLRG